MSFDTAGGLRPTSVLGSMLATSTGASAGGSGRRAVCLSFGLRSALWGSAEPPAARAAAAGFGERCQGSQPGSVAQPLNTTHVASPSNMASHRDCKRVCAFQAVAGVMQVLPNKSDWGRLAPVWLPFCAEFAQSCGKRRE